MIKEHRRTFKVLRVLFDLGLVLGCYFLLYGFTLKLANPFHLVLEHPDYQWRLPVILLLCWAASFLATGIYNNTRQASPLPVFGLTAKVLIFMLFIFSVGTFVFKIQYISRKFFFMYYCLCFGLLSLSKATEFSLLRLFRKMGFNTLSIVLIGGGKELEEALQVFQNHAEWGYRIAGIVPVGKRQAGEAPARVLGSLRKLRVILKTKIVDELIFAAPRASSKDFETVLAEAAQSGINVRVLLQENVRAWKTQLDHLGSLPVLVLSPDDKNAYLKLFKSAFDRVLALALLLIFSWLFVLIALGILITMGRPVFFRQKRAGYNGRVFFLYKFRTMVPDARQMQAALEKANEMSGPVFKVKDDPRVTAFGKLLRRTSLDELPQLFNVLKGELSLVGPRPLAKYEARKVPLWAWRRYSVKPGITCLWQVMGRNQLSFEQWMELDLKYIDNWSLWMDLNILLKTIPAVLSSRGAY